MVTTSLVRYRSPRSLLFLALFLVVVIAVGGVIGTTTAPAGWYADLQKPAFNPPNWVFAPVWFILYVMIAVAGWRTFLRDPSGPEMKLWYGQMVLNWLWTPVFFAAHLIWPAFIVISALWVAIAAFIIVTSKSDRVSAVMFVPYLAWVSFAALLNLSIGVLN